jgi:hypothetical protein
MAVQGAVLAAVLARQLLALQQLVQAVQLARGLQVL